jgi:hypothetical protein
MARNDEIVLNKIDATAEKADLSGQLNARPVVISVAITADASAGQSITVPYDMTIYDMSLVCTAASGGGTVTLRSGTNAISDAVVCAVDTTIGRAGTLDDTYTAVTTSTSLNVITNGAADRALVYIYGIRS